MRSATGLKEETAPSQHEREQSLDWTQDPSFGFENTGEGVKGQWPPQRDVLVQASVFVDAVRISQRPIGSAFFGFRPLQAL